MAYAIRVTPRSDDDADLKLTKAALDKLGGAHVGCREIASSVHVHIVLWTDKRVSDVRNTFHNTFGKTGNGVLSIKAAKDDKGAMRYCCKGTNTHPEPRGEPPDVLWHYGHTVYPTPIDAWNAYWELSVEIKATPGLSFMTQVEHYMVQNQMVYSPHSIATALVEMTVSKKNQMNEFFLAAVGKQILARNNREYKKEVINQLALRICPDGH